MRTILAPTDIRDPETNKPLYVHAQIRSPLYWWWRTLRLFSVIVWRVWDVNPDGSNYRIAWGTAWDVARGVHRDGLTRHDVCPKCDQRLRGQSGLCSTCWQLWQTHLAQSDKPVPF